VNKNFDYGAVEGAGAAPMWPRVVRRAYGVAVRDKALVIEFGKGDLRVSVSMQDIRGEYAGHSG
jgi:hypothetical protein